MSSISSVGSSGSLDAQYLASLLQSTSSGVGTTSGSMDTQFAENLIDSTGSTNGSLNESQFIDLLQENPQLAQGLNSVEGGSSSTTVDQLFQKLSDGSSSISLSELGSALGQLREQMQQNSPPPPPTDATSTSSSIDMSSTSSSLDTSTGSSLEVTGSTTIGELATSDGHRHHAHVHGSGDSAAADTSTSSSLDLSSSSSISTLTSLGSSTDLASVVAALEQVLQNLQQQQQGYNQNGSASANPMFSVFQTMS